MFIDCTLRYFLDYLRGLLINGGFLVILTAAFTYFKESSLRTSLDHLYSYRWYLLVAAIMLSTYRFIVVNLGLGPEILKSIYFVLLGMALVGITEKYIPL